MELEAKERQLETYFCKYNLKSFLRAKAKELTIPIEDELEYSIAVDMLAYMLFYKNTLTSVLVPLLFVRFKDINKILKVLTTLVNADFLDYTRAHRIITKNFLSEEDSRMISLLLYPLPMVVKPLPLTRNSQSGYKYLPATCLILRRHFFKEDINLDHLNRLNSIPLRLNKAVLANCSPKKEIINRKERENYERFREQQHGIAEFFQEEPFYLTHKYDARGRVYCQGYHLSYQSDDFTNALIEFADGEKVI